MSTAARKARKQAGEKFTRTPKIGTPPEHRVGTRGTAHAILRWTAPGIDWFSGGPKVTPVRSVDTTVTSAG